MTKLAARPDDCDAGYEGEVISSPRLETGACLRQNAGTLHRSERYLSVGRGSGESGAILILALIFMVVASMVVTGLVAWSGNDIMNIGHLKSARSATYSSNGAIQVAISNIRYIDYVASSTPSLCPNSGSQPSTQPFNIDQEAVDVVCVAGLNLGGAGTRTVMLSAYAESQCGSIPCAGNPFVQAVVTFNDTVSPSSNDCTPAGAQTTCGTSMTVYSWVVQPGLT